MTRLAHTASLIARHPIATLSVAGSLSAGLATAQLTNASTASILISAAVGCALLVTLWRVLANQQALRLESAVQAERRRLARDLHDSVAQELAFIIAQSRRLAAALPDDRALIDITNAATSALDDSRTTIRGLHEPGPWMVGEAISRRARVLASRAGIHLDVGVGDDRVAGADVQHCLLSILREGISNAARHAHATQLDVRVRCSRTMIELSIADDGCGFNPSSVGPSPTGGFGLLGMHQRAQQLHGQLAVASTPSGGTTITVAIPDRGAPTVNLARRYPPRATTTTTGNGRSGQRWGSAIAMWGVVRGPWRSRAR